MTGYTPVFKTVFTGTLHGQWPETGLWLCLLALSDKHGNVDCTPQYVSSVTGLTVEEVIECIAKFMQPDPYSRTQDFEGRRLTLIDDSRPWGWHIVNHEKYREKARKQYHNERDVESGKNKERLAASRNQSRPDATGGDQTRPAVTDSHTHTQTHTQTKNKKGAGAPVWRGNVEGLDETSFQQWLDYRKSLGKPLKAESVMAAARKLAAFGADQANAVEHSIASGYQGLYAESRPTYRKPEPVITWRPPPDGKPAT